MDYFEEFLKIQEEFALTEDDKKTVYIEKMRDIAQRCSEEQKIYIYSYIIDIANDEKAAFQLIDLALKSDELSIETKYFIYNQIKSLQFRGKISGLENDVNNEYLLYMVIDSFKEKLHNYLTFIPRERRNSKLALIITSQFLSTGHGPTKSALARCAALKKAGREVLLINTAELQPWVGSVPFYNAFFGVYNENHLEVEYMEWNEVKVPFFQCENNMPDIETYKCVLETVQNIKPEYAVEIGGGSILASLVNECIPVLSVGMVPSSIGEFTTDYCTLGRRLNDNDRQKIKKLGKREEHVIEHKFTSDLIKQEQLVTRKMLGISKDAFILAVVGARLSYEADNKFFDMLECVAEEEDITIMMLGYFDREDEVKQKYPALSEKIIFEGFKHDILAYLGVCNLYVNPIRTGGGTSCVEAMQKGLPVVTTGNGDVAVNAGEGFITENYETMQKLIVRYKKDNDFYRKQSELALLRAGELQDTEKAFIELIEEFLEREEKYGRK